MATKVSTAPGSRPDAETLRDAARRRLALLGDGLGGPARGVEIGDGDRSAIGEAVNALMGSKPEARFRFIQDRAAFAHDLDI